MKKKLISVLLVIITVLSLAVPVCAATPGDVIFENEPETMSVYAGEYIPVWVEYTPALDEETVCVAIADKNANIVAIYSEQYTYATADEKQPVAMNIVFDPLEAGEYVAVCFAAYTDGSGELIPNENFGAMLITVLSESKKPSSGWVKVGKAWAYYKNGKSVKNTWKKDSKGWCYIGEYGFTVSDKWVKDSKGWCYLDSNGYMAKNKWVMDSVGWCYVGKDGYCVKNTWKKDSKGWCYLDSKGRMVVNGWAKDSKGWCYLDSNGYMVKDCWVYDDGYYRIDKNGYMLSNKWFKNHDGWRYLAKSGKMVTLGWAKDSGGWLALDDLGRIITSGWVKDGDDFYYLDDDGYMVTGVYEIGSRKVFFESNGVYNMEKTGELNGGGFAGIFECIHF